MLKSVYFVRSAGSYYVGDTAGFPEDQAERLVRLGVAVYQDQPAPEGAEPPPPPPAEPAATPIETPPTPPAPEGADTPPVTPPTEDNAPADPASNGEDAVPGDIPEDWQNLHGNTRKKLAKQISGTPVESLEEADAVIAAELQRRAAAQ